MTFFYRRPPSKRSWTVAGVKPNQRVPLQLERLEDREVPAQVFAITAPAPGVQSLITFDSATPGSVTVVGNVRGIEPGARVVGMDIRPSTGVMYLVASNDAGTARLYTLNPATGDATLVNDAITFNLSGTAFGVDITLPTSVSSESMRITSNTGQQVAVNLGSGSGTPLVPLSYATNDPGAGMTPNVVAAAYGYPQVSTQLFPQIPGVTILYGIDSARDQLVFGSAVTGLGGPSNGPLVSIGGLGFDTTEQASLDIQASNTLQAFASLTALGAPNSTFAIIDLVSGAATPVGTIGGATTGVVLAMAVDPGPLPSQPPPLPDPNQVINQLVIANLQRLFAQPLPPQIALAQIVQLGDANGDGFADVTALVGLRVRVRGRMAIQLFSLTFDGLSPSGALIAPRLLGTF